MKNKKINKVILAGTVFDGPVYHGDTKRGEKLYKFTIGTERISGYVDILPCVIKERYLDEIIDGKNVKVCGTLTTKSYKKDGKRKLDVYVYVYCVEDYEKDENYVEIQGILCKEPVFRTTPLGIEISDAIIASNFINGNSAYIPSIAWWDNAKLIGNSKAGDEFFTVGRFQSRPYIKEETHCVAYEYCIQNLIQMKGEHENGRKN